MHFSPHYWLSDHLCRGSDSCAVFKLFSHTTHLQDFSFIMRSNNDESSVMKGFKRAFLHRAAFTLVLLRYNTLKISIFDTAGEKIHNTTRTEHLLFNQRNTAAFNHKTSHAFIRISFTFAFDWSWRRHEAVHADRGRFSSTETRGDPVFCPVLSQTQRDVSSILQLNSSLKNHKENGTSVEGRNGDGERHPRTSSLLFHLQNHPHFWVFGARCSS